MSSMYTLPRCVPAAGHVVPADIMYKLASYHADKDDEPAQNGLTNGGSSTSLILDPVKSLEARQLQLIDALNKYADNVNAVLKTIGKAASEGAVKSQKEAPAKKAEAAKQAAEPQEEGKKGKDKDAKKEARKAAKADAKNKVATGEAPKPAAGKKAAVHSPGAAWNVVEEKLSTETGQSNTACLPPHLADYPVDGFTCATVTLTITEKDIAWTEKLARVASRRGVAFAGAINNKVEKPKTTVNVVKGDAFSLSTSTSMKLSTRTSAWKLLGLASGLFSRGHDQAVQSAHQHQWLVQLDRVLSSAASIESVIREASQFLSRFDTLGSYFNVSLADVLLRSLLPEGASLPNNVELWRNRVDAVLA